MRLYAAMQAELEARRDREIPRYGAAIPRERRVSERGFPELAARAHGSVQSTEAHVREHARSQHPGQAEPRTQKPAVRLDVVG